MKSHGGEEVEITWGEEVEITWGEKVEITRGRGRRTHMGMRK
jgi:hypothetical protein